MMTAVMPVMNLWCELSEIGEHEHDENCYMVVDIIDEDTYHIHTDACYGTAEEAAALGIADDDDDDVHSASNAESTETNA